IELVPRVARDLSRHQLRQAAGRPRHLRSNELRRPWPSPSSRYSLRWNDKGRSRWCRAVTMTDDVDAPVIACSTARQYRYVTETADFCDRRECGGRGTLGRFAAVSRGWPRSSTDG